MRTLLVPPPLRDGELVLDPDEAHHARTVLRLRPGDPVRVVDGDGRAGSGRIMQADPGRCVLMVDGVEVVADPPASALTIAVAPPKGDRFEDMVRQLTELGVGRIVPLRCARSERMPASLARANRVAGEALKQCRRARLPRLGDPIDVPALAAGGARLIVLDPRGAPASPTPSNQEVTLVIGPEGGFTDDELTALDAAGAVRARLCPTILRIETAAVAAAAVWAAAFERMEPA